MTRRRVAIEAGAVLALFTLVTVALCWPIPIELRTSVIGTFPGDAAGTVWWLDALQQTGYQLFGTTTFDQIAVPAGYDQASSLNVQNLLAYYPAFLATKVVGEVAAYNLCVLTGFVLSGAAMYFLARRLGAVPAVAVWAGLAWLLFPWHLVRAEGHAAYVHTEWLPLLVVAMHSYWRRSDAIRLVLVGLAVIACWLTAGIFGVMALALVLTCAGVTAVVVRPVRSGVRSGALLAASAVVASGLVYLLAIPGGGDGGIGGTRDLVDLRRFGLRLSELVVPSDSSSIFGEALREYHLGHLHGSNVTEASNYLGWVTIVLAVVGLVALSRSSHVSDAATRTLGAGLAASAVVSLALALPSPLWLLGYRWDRTPARLLFDAVPAFRVPSRWSVIVMLAAVILGTLGLQALWSRFGRNGGRFLPYVAVGVVIGLTVLELGAQLGSSSVRTRPVPHQYDLLARTKPGTLAEYPLWRNDTIWNLEYLFWQREHGRRLINGAAVHEPGDSFRRALVDPTAPGIASQLAALGVTAITTRFNTPSAMQRLRRSGFALVGRAPGNVAVWRVTAPPAPAVVTLSPNFEDPDPWNGRSVQRLFGSEGYIELRAREPTRGTLGLTLLAKGAGTRHVTIGSRRYKVRAEGTPVRVPFAVRRGLSRIPIRIDGIPADEVGLAATVPALSTEGGSRRASESKSS